MNENFKKKMSEKKWNKEKIKKKRIYVKMMSGKERADQ